MPMAGRSSRSDGSSSKGIVLAQFLMVCGFSRSTDSPVEVYYLIAPDFVSWLKNNFFVNV